MKTCICAIAKNENKYIKEWVDYHLKLGFNQIFIFDNNNNETFEEVINDYILNNKVYIINDRNIVEYMHLYKVYKDFYIKYHLLFDWICYIDIDEFIYLKNYNNINEYLSLAIFNNISLILLNWKFYTTDNKEYLFYYINKPVLYRFNKESKYIANNEVKSIIRTNIDCNFICGIHNVACNVISSDCDGNIIMNNSNTKILNYNSAYIKHIYGKSLEELINKKISSCYADLGTFLNNNRTHDIILTFYEINKYSKYIEELKEKIKVLCNKLNIKCDFLNNIK